MKSFLRTAFAALALCAAFLMPRRQAVLQRPITLTR